MQPGREMEMKALEKVSAGNYYVLGVMGAKRRVFFRGGGEKKGLTSASKDMGRKFSRSPI